MIPLLCCCFGYPTPYSVALGRENLASAPGAGIPFLCVCVFLGLKILKGNCSYMRIAREMMVLGLDIEVLVSWSRTWHQRAHSIEEAWLYSPPADQGLAPWTWPHCLWSSSAQSHGANPNQVNLPFWPFEVLEVHDEVCGCTHSILIAVTGPNDN